MSSNNSFPPKGYFNPTKYKNEPFGPFSDGSTALGNAGQVISFYHEPSAQSVYFKAFITAFNETYASDWVSETVFGRVDPIQHFKQTSRRISLGFKVPAATHSEAYDNLVRVQQLIQYLYPNYTDAGNTQTLSQNPFVRLKVMNLAQKTDPAGTSPAPGTDGAPSSKQVYERYTSTADPSKGILGTISNLTIVHNLENVDIGVLMTDKGKNTILPKMIEVNLDFTAIHETNLGWDKENNFATPAFPYGAIGAEDSKNPNTTANANANAAERALSEQQKQDALARWGRLGGKARMRADLRYLNRMADKGDLNAAQQANVNYLLGAFKGAGGAGDRVLDTLTSFDPDLDAAPRRTLRDISDNIYDDFID
jgi:hypothetical protein